MSNDNDIHPILKKKIYPSLTAAGGRIHHIN
jgi:hypothetical protein